MKKVFEIETKNNSKVGYNASNIWNIFAEDLIKAIIKVEKYKSEKEDIIYAKLKCIVDEDKDLEDYLE